SKTILPTSSTPSGSPTGTETPASTATLTSPTRSGKGPASISTRAVTTKPGAEPSSTSTTTPSAVRPGSLQPARDPPTLVTHSRRLFHLVASLDTGLTA